MAPFVVILHFGLRFQGLKMQEQKIIMFLIREKLLSLCLETHFPAMKGYPIFLSFRHFDL